MRRTRERSSPVAGFNRAEAYQNTLIPDLEQVTSSTPADDVTYTPNFLDISNDCADMSEFIVKADQIAHGEEPTGKEMSQKICRFCS